MSKPKKISLIDLEKKKQSKLKKVKLIDISIESNKKCDACGRKRACLNKGDCVHLMNYLAYGDGYSK